MKILPDYCLSTPFSGCIEGYEDQKEASNIIPEEESLRIAEVYVNL